ncbi:Histone deacetylase domain [Phytophthora cactorum]|nr:Histone deacetylase domain [Phytophthora cactorum]
MNVGYVYDERYLWHRPWSQHYSALVEPFRHWESPETKRRFHSLLAVSGLLDQLLERLSLREEGGNAGEEAPFSQFAFDIARLSVGGVLAAVDAVMDGRVDTAYALTRPPGHHAVADRGMGFCLLNNVAITAKHLLETCSTQIKKIAIVDYDVHHGNGTQEAFYDDDRRGEGKGLGFNVNLPLPPGSGSGAYEYAFKSAVVPALESFKPDFVLVSSGFDASYADPLAAMILSSSVFRVMAHELIEAAKRLCRGRIVFAHEGGYSETDRGTTGVQDVGKQIKDPFLSEVERWEYQELQEHQKEVVDTVVDLRTNIKQT